MTSRRYLTAFNRSVRARGLETDAVCGPLVVLGRDVARELDSAVGPITASSAAATYRAILKELDRHASAVRRSEKVPATDESKTPRQEASASYETPRAVSSLTEFRERAGIADTVTDYPHDSKEN